MMKVHHLWKKMFWKQCDQVKSENSTISKLENYSSCTGESNSEYAHEERLGQRKRPVFVETAIISFTDVPVNLKVVPVKLMAGKASDRIGAFDNE